MRLFTLSYFTKPHYRVAIFREKNYSAGHGTDGTFDSFRRNTACLKNALNSVPSHSAEFRSIPGKMKSSEFRSEPFRRREKHSELLNFIPSHSTEFFFLTEFRFVPFRIELRKMGRSETHETPRKEHFFPRNNENFSESNPQNFFGTEFRWPPYSINVPGIPLIF